MVTKIRLIEHLYKIADHKIVELNIDIENQNIWGKYYWKINKGYLMKVIIEIRKVIFLWILILRI